MSKKKENIAVIPARIGSKRIKEKNIKNFINKPIILWTINQLKKTKLFDKIYVSTDSFKIINILKKSGFKNFILRDETLSNDYVGTTPVIVDAIKKISSSQIIKNICCVYPCNPFLQKKNLIKAFKELKKNNNCIIFPVLKYSHPIERALSFKKNNFIEENSKINLLKRTQDFKDMYHDSGSFYLASKKAWLSKKKIKKIGIKINWWEAIDIDTIEDWQKAELIFKMTKKFT